MLYRDSWDAMVFSAKEGLKLSNNQLVEFSLLRGRKHTGLDDVMAGVFGAQTGMAVTIAHGMLSGSISDVGSQLLNITLATTAVSIALNRVVAGYRKAMSEDSTQTENPL